MAEVLTALLELVVSLGGYYVLRAVGVGVFWALTLPGIAVAALAVWTTVRRRRIDMIGLLVLAEVLASITLVLATQDARIAAVREPVYVAIAGVFCLVTLALPRPFTAASTASIASFGDPVRVEAFETAWRAVPRYRLVQRAMTAAFGVLMLAASALRVAVVCSLPDVAHAVDLSNTIGLVMWGSVGLVAAVLSQPARRIIQDLVEHPG